MMGEEEEMEVETGVEMEERKVAAEEEVQAQVYPAPLHSHEEVVRDKLAFVESLRRFHSSMSTKFMIPVIGGRELDLHLLYVEVTRRGGLAKVIEEKKWREVIAAFKFPPTTTSASFVLRRYYLSLLHHYEQVYYFRAQGGLVPPAASSQTRTPPGKLERGVVVSDSTMQTSKTRKRPLPEPQNRGEVALNSLLFPSSFGWWMSMAGTFFIVELTGGECFQSTLGERDSSPPLPPQLTTRHICTGRQCPLVHPKVGILCAAESMS
ncbi:high mobility group [Musa troglodytarum]|uniref:High mobility group n=1 Tax=Musa troglodytarum TaxID=320322 RepID=A0A9E7KVV0_9LILI|nr:high mobility group [Musa troglodytarum]